MCQKSKATSNDHHDNYAIYYSFKMYIVAMLENSMVKMLFSASTLDLLMPIISLCLFLQNTYSSSAQDIWKQNL